MIPMYLLFHCLPLDVLTECTKFKFPMLQNLQLFQSIIYEGGKKFKNPDITKITVIPGGFVF